VEDFAFDGAFDPTGESTRLGMALFSQLLLRTLVTYPHVAGPRGLVPVADLATDADGVSPDGLTYTFELKEGVRFGPPVSRPVTSADVDFAFRRIDTASLAAQYGYLYDGLIEGMNGPVDPMPDDISGIDTPNARTVVFHLTHPAGDFLHRLALPATAPMPPEVAGCFRRAGDYGRDLVSTGPYMLQGAEAVDVSRCRRIEPMGGFQPTRSLVLVRNPDYDPGADSAAVRENLPPTIAIRIETNTDLIAAEIARGDVDATLGAFPYPIQATQGLRGVTLHWVPLTGLSYFAMNVLVPPFDDVHVRRAVNLVLNRDALIRAMAPWGHGVVATHLFPPLLLSNGSAAAVVRTGALAAARREMTLSAYDADKDGMCDATICEKVLYITPTVPPEINSLPMVREELDGIGVHLVFRELDTGTAYTTYQTVRNLVPISLQRGLVPRYPDPAAIAASLQSSGIRCEDQTNFSEVGFTETLAEECDVLKQYRKVRDHIPNLDARIEECESLAGAARSACWVSFDRYVMTEIVPWAPLRLPDVLIVTGKTLTKFEFDQAFGTISLCHIAAAAA
jgi:peptide/nickel transport system substrate-binding protein